MPLFTDQTGRVIVMDKPAGRIISIVPSQTELLFDLGLNAEIIGITKFCIHPNQWFQTKTKVGGTKQLKMDVIRQLNPDLVIANTEENEKEQIEELAKHYPVWVSDVCNLEDAYEMIEQLGLLTNRAIKSEEIISSIQKEFSRLLRRSPFGPDRDSQPDTYRVPAIYLIWQKPFMAAGGDTFINAMMKAAGFDNVFKHQTRYPEVNSEELQAANCELLLLSSEPFPFKQKHIDELQPLLPNTKIILVDGEMFSWYGSRLLRSPEYFIKLRKHLTSEL
jgi:ABC-type Fe3+-hydroxamate transport system substrate-binding protein